MALYFVDFENVHDSGINGVTSLTGDDEILIFYSMKSEHMSFDTHVSIMQSEAKVKYIKLRRSAKNYLDFQLVTHLGFVIGSGQPGPYFIISKDTGYDSVVDYWKDHGVTILRQPSIGYNHTQKKATGQAPVHNTPPAQVLVKEGGTISEFQVPVVLSAQAVIPADAPQAPEAASRENEQPEPIHSSVTTQTEETDASDLVPAQEPQPEKKSRSSRSRHSSSRKKTSEDASAASQEDVPAASEKESADTAQAGEDTPAQENLASQEAEETKEIRISPQTLPESYRKKVRTALRGKNIPSANYSSIYKAIINSYDKLALNNLLVKTFGSSKGGEIYNLIRPIFMDYQSVQGS